MKKAMNTIPEEMYLKLKENETFLNMIKQDKDLLEQALQSKIKFYT